MTNHNTLTPSATAIGIGEDSMQATPHNDAVDPADELAMKISSWVWDGASVQDILTFAGSFGLPAAQLIYNNFPEGWPDTVPEDCMEQVKLCASGCYQENSEDYSTTYFKIMAFDESGMALTQDLELFNYTDTEKVTYHVMEQDQALVKYEVESAYSNKSTGMRMG